MVLDLEGHDGRRAQVAGNPIKFKGETEAPHVYPPKLGQHSRDVLCSLLGMNDAELDVYCENGVILEAGNQK